MMRLGWAAALTVCGVLSATAARAGDDDGLKFDGAIGVIPVALVNNAAVANTVLGVPPGGRPWLIRTFKASVSSTGKIVARGTGLILGGTNAIGTRGGITEVALSLYCGGADKDGNPLSTSSTLPIPLDLNGNFSFKGQLEPMPPNPCTSPVLLVRNSSKTPTNPTGIPSSWFAAGILSDED
jgi:hypothetical protein